MSYVPVTLPSNLPSIIGGFIRGPVEDYLRDVHFLLSTMNPNAHPKVQIQTPIALTVLAALAGVSKVLYWRKTVDGGFETGDRKLFEGFLVDFYPADLDPPTGVNMQEAAKILYGVFRCPIVHSLRTDGQDDLPTFARVPGYVSKIGRVFRGTADAEQRVEQMERDHIRPGSDTWLVVRTDATVLWLDSLYWGLRKAIERWALDKAQVNGAAPRVADRIKALAQQMP